MRVYVDTSVVGGMFDKEFMWQTKPFWDAVCDGQINVILSKLLWEEIEGAPKHVKVFLSQLPKSQVETIDTTKECYTLAEWYIAEKVVGKSSFEDCLHIALATIANADVLASWNFKHIVNVTRIRGYNSVNLKLGYPQIDIRTPNEVIEHDN